MKSPITTHVLDTATGKPANGIPVKLEVHDGAQWKGIGQGITDTDGRASNLLPNGFKITTGTYRITFDLQGYFVGRKSFYPFATIAFTIDDSNQHYHVPLLLSGFGFSTYRGS
jgi:5-hydroxyisourate hydrolase